MSLLTSHSIQPGSINRQYNMMRTPSSTANMRSVNPRSLYLFPNGATGGPLLSAVSATGSTIPQNAFYYSGGEDAATETVIPATSIPKFGNFMKSTTAAATASPPQKEDAKMVWGEPTWFLLHTLAEKIPENTFMARREDILNVIYTICTNLPCNECSDHAKQYLTTTVNLRAAVRTRDDLKTVLFNFHNYVNWRKKYAIFPREELDEKYARANTKNVVYNFMIHFQDKSKNPNMISTELYRSRIILQLRDWFKQNIGMFME